MSLASYCLFLSSFCNVRPLQGDKERESERGIGYEKAIIAFIMLIKAGTQMAVSRMDCMCVCKGENVCDSLRVCVQKDNQCNCLSMCVCVCV